MKEDTFHVNVPSLNQDFKAKKVSSSSYYRGKLSSDTRSTFELSYKKYVESEPEDEEPEWSPLTGISNTALNNWIRIRSLASLLVERGIFTEEDYEKRLDEIGDRDLEEMKKDIFELKDKDEE